MRRPGPVGAMLLEGFGSRLAFGLLGFALPLYGHQLGLSVVEIGVLVSLSTLVSVVLKPLVGGLADRAGLKRALLVALALRCALCLGYVAAAAPWQVFAVRGAHGVSDSLRDPAVHALLAERGRPGSMARTFAWYQTAKSVAGSVGKGLAGLVISLTGGFTAVFVAAFALSLLPVLAVAVAVPGDQRAPHGEPGTSGPQPVTALAGEPQDGLRRPLAYAGFGALVSGTSGLLTALFPLLATEYAGLTPAETGLLYLLTPALALTGPWWGWVADRTDSRVVLALRSCCNAMAAVVLLVSPTLVGLWAGRSLDDLGKAAFRPAWGALMAEVSSRDTATRARTMGHLTAGDDVGSLVAPVAAGALWSVGGPVLLLVGRVVLALATEVYAWWLHRPADDRRGRSKDGPRPPAQGARSTAGRGPVTHGSHTTRSTKRPTDRPEARRAAAADVTAPVLASRDDRVDRPGPGGRVAGPVVDVRHGGDGAGGQRVRGDVR